MAAKIRLSRNELAEFLPSQRAIRAFERVFTETEAIVDIDMPSTEIAAGTALAGVENVGAEVQQLQGQSLQVMAWLGL